MNSNSGIIPTVDLATTGAYPYMYGNGFGSGLFGGDGIWAIVLIALLFGNGGWGGFGFGGNGLNNIATTDYISSEFTQRDVNNGFMNLSTQVSDGFSAAATNLCNVRSDILTGNMGLQNSIQDAKYAGAINSANTQRDILLQTTQLENQASINALQSQAKMDECCCQIRSEALANTQKILDVLNQNTIDDLRSQVNDLKNTITANGIGTSIVNQVRPYPVPSYVVSSPYQSLYNPYGYYNNGFYGTTVI